mgnify:CR=1 FL=1
MVNKDRYSVQPDGKVFAITDNQTGKNVHMLDTLPAANAICKIMNDEAAQSFSPNKEK